jgi:hypothetical protein
VADDEKEDVWLVRLENGSTVSGRQAERLQPPSRPLTDWAGSASPSPPALSALALAAHRRRCRRVRPRLQGPGIGHGAGSARGAARELGSGTCLRTHPPPRRRSLRVLSEAC